MLLHERLITGHKKMSKYLLEIGTEELPYRFIPQAIDQLKAGFKKFFEENNLGYKKIEVLATPRRLAIIVDELADKQSDVEKTLKGPIKKVAYDEQGNLTQAGKGFLAKNGVEEKDAYIENDYLHAKVFNKGKLTSELLTENVPQIILKLQGPYFMRWAAFDEKFSRPIRWIVSILDKEEVPVQIIDVKSSKFTRGHRFTDAANGQNIEINSPDEYVEKLKKAHVFVDQNERKALIVELAKKEADKLGAITKYDEDLLDEVTYLCEYPIPVVCDFKKEYLDVPDMVTVTVMASHQRYFALYKDGKLINKFITITNYIGNEFENIKAGNERVVTARLDDAIFFFKEDTKKPFADNVESLKGITFQKGMGSMFDKTQRIIELSKDIAGKLGVTSPAVERTALLCKADLTTNLVFEFTELQGFIGADYARHSKEGDKVVEGIKEHYFPLNAESELAEGIEGQIVGIADKIDTICAVFANGKKPTGSSDPLGLRRAALGIIKTVTTKNLELNLSDLIGKAVADLPKKAENEKELLAQIEDFFIQRLIIFLAETYRKDVLEACAKNKNPLLSLCDFVERVNLLSELAKEENFTSMLESANRTSRILKELVKTTVIPGLFKIDAENVLFEKVSEIKEDNYENLIGGLKKANPAIEKFFEDVLVMDNDEKIKENRLALLSMLKRKYDLIADFSALQS
jgi:glycyl-tRNA synthetase beta chain